MAPRKPGSLFYFRLRPKERRTMLLIGDSVMAFLALILALYFWARSDPYLSFSTSILQHIPAWFFLLPFLWIILLVELYNEHNAGNWQSTLRGILTAAIIGLGLYMLLYFTSTPRALPRRGVAGFVIAASVLTLSWRALYIRIFTAPRFLHRVLLVGGGDSGKIILKIVKTLWPPPYHLIGIIDDDPQKINKKIEGYPVLGGSNCLLELIHEHQITDLIVAISGQIRAEMFQALLAAQERGVEITRMPVAYEELLGRIPIRYLEADWILRSFVDQARVNHLYEMVKRLMDILIGCIGLFILAFLFPFIALAVILDSGFPVFYLQTRSGRGGQTYSIIKFRTMRKDAEPNGQPQWAEENDARATRVGHFLRKTHIDELPQLFNVIRGDMSMVGPRSERPELITYFEKYIPFYRARLLVKPGITGWAQVNFGYAATIEETTIKLEYDLYYIKRRNLWTDITILIRTPSMVLGLRGR